MAKSYLIIGAGRFGSAVGRTLYDLGEEVVLVDRDPGTLEPMMDQVSDAAVLDATDEDALRRFGLGSFDTVIVAIGEDLEASILATVSAKAAGARYVISKADTKTGARILASVGADELVRPEHDMGVRLATQLASPRQVARLDLGDQHGIVEIETRDRLCGPLKDLHLPSRFGVQVIAVHRGDDLIVSPGADFEIAEGDRIAVIGHNDSFAELRDFVNTA